MSDPSINKTKMVGFWVQEREKAQILEAAKRRRVRLSDYVRQVVLKQAEADLAVAQQGS